jgi:CTP synthase
MKMTLPDDVILAHVTYFPAPAHINELKSKPTQLSVKALNGMGIQPDFIVGRGEKEIDDKRKEKVAFFSNMDKEDIISNPDCKSIYEIPLIFRKEKFGKKVLKKLKLETKNISMNKWQKMVENIYAKKEKKVKIGIIAKYIATGDYELKDSYTSLLESINHAAWNQKIDVEIVFIHAEKLEKKQKTALDKLKSVDAILVPIGWGKRGVEGKIDAIRYARENKIPYLGLCYGMQLASIEFARNVVGFKDAHTQEVDPKSKHLIVHEIPFNEKYQKIKGEGASMRLGAYDCVLKKGSLAEKIYKKHNAFKNEKKNLISERHRHRFEFNNQYRKNLEEKGFVISGTSPDNFFVEMIELPQEKHPFFLATQAHPEYKSAPLQPHPIFIEYIKAIWQEKTKNK